MADPQIEQELNTLKSDIAALRSDISDLASAVRDVASRRASHVRDSVTDDLRQRREEMRARFNTARDRGRETVDVFEKNVGDHPLGSLAAAVGVGFILGKLFNLGERH